jgi:DNA-binding transcriptional ArsR family regulator
MAKYRNNTFGDVVGIGKALGDPARVRALAALRGRELCACQIVELLGLASSTVSRHMAVLRQAGLALARKEGRWMHFRRPGAEATPAAAALEWVDRSLSGDARAEEDRRTLERILKIDPEALCRRQCGKC